MLAVRGLIVMRGKGGMGGRRGTVGLEMGL